MAERVKDADEHYPDIVAEIGSLRRYAAALANTPEEVDDLVQECLTSVLARAETNGSLNHVRNLRAYLSTALHNIYVDHVSAQMRARSKMPARDTDIPWQGSGAPTQGASVELHDLQAALDDMPSVYREVVVLVGVEGFSYKEAAAFLDVPVGTVMSRLSRARRLLRYAYRDEPEEGIRQLARG